MRVVVALGGISAVATFALVLTLQTLVWSPMGAAPHLSYVQLLDALAQHGETLPFAWVVGAGLLGVTLSIALAIVSVALRWRPLTVAAGQLGLLVLGAPAYWVASFPAGIAVADGLQTYGGDHAPGGRLLYLVSLTAVVALCAIGFARSVRGGRDDLLARGSRPLG